MKNKHGVKITPTERKYFNSIKQSLRAKVKSINDTLKPYQTETYLRNKTNYYTPTMKKTNINSFKNREEFLKEVERLSQLNTDLAIYKPRKPKYLNELPKRLQKDFNKQERRSQKQQGLKVRKNVIDKVKNRLNRLVNVPFINKKNEIYRDNMITAIRKSFSWDLAKELIEILTSLSEIEFLMFFLSRPHETISFIYHDRGEMSQKQLNLLQSILDVKK